MLLTKPSSGTGSPVTDVHPIMDNNLSSFSLKGALMTPPPPV